ncbi:Protein FAR1-RELATED SEQUENCE 5 [Linum perenne]
MENSNVLYEDNKDELDRLRDLTEADVMQLKFDSEEEAYIWYNWYALASGFGIRKDKPRYGKEKELISRTFVCESQGKRDEKLTERKRKAKTETRCGCKALLRVRMDKTSLRWSVVAFQREHSHGMQENYVRHYIRSHRGISEADAALVDMREQAGMRLNDIHNLAVHEAGGHNKVGYTKKDLYNLSYKIRRKDKIHRGDASSALTYLMSRKNDDKQFFMEYTKSDDNKLLNLFWADSMSIADYDCFGELLALDTTYKKNKYNMPLVIFAGVNHHFQTCLFGSALLENENATNYIWVLETFAKAMGGKKPDAVVTDGDKSMLKAINQRSAGLLFSREAYDRFTTELEVSTLCSRLSCEETGAVHIYKVKMYNRRDHIWEVRFNVTTTSAQCSCMKFRSTGMPCCHMIFILKEEDITEVPTSFVLFRQSRNPKSPSLMEQSMNTNFHSTVTTRYGILQYRSLLNIWLGAKSIDTFKICWNDMISTTKKLIEVVRSDGLVPESDTYEYEDVLDPSNVKAKGSGAARPKGKARMCSNCKEYGHNAAGCKNERRVLSDDEIDEGTPTKKRVNTRRKKTRAASEANPTAKNKNIRNVKIKKKSRATSDDDEDDGVMCTHCKQYGHDVTICVNEYKSDDNDDSDYTNQAPKDVPQTRRKTRSQHKEDASHDKKFSNEI